MTDQPRPESSPDSAATAAEGVPEGGASVPQAAPAPARPQPKYGQYAPDYDPDAAKTPAPAAQHEPAQPGFGDTRSGNPGPAQPDGALPGYPTPGYGQQSQWQPPQGYGQPNYGGAPVPPNGVSGHEPLGRYPGKSLGTAGFIVVLVSLLIPFIGILTSIVGFVLSIIGLRQSRKAGHGNGLALAGIIVWAFAAVCLILFTIWMIVMFNDPAFQAVFQDEFQRSFCADPSIDPGVYTIFGIDVVCAR